MAENDTAERPLMQRVYDRVWLLAVLAFLFWLVTYVVWGLLDMMSIPAGVIGL